MIVKVKESRHVGGFRVWLRFDSGESGEADLADLAHRYRAAEPLRDEKALAFFYLENCKADSERSDNPPAPRIARMADCFANPPYEITKFVLRLSASVS